MALALVETSFQFSSPVTCQHSEHPGSLLQVGCVWSCRQPMCLVTGHLPKQCVFWPEALGNSRVNKPMVAVADWTEKGSGASEVSLGGAVSIATGNASPLSEQQLVDFQIFKGPVDFIHTAIPKISPTIER